MPTPGTVIRWMAEDPRVRSAVAEARAARAELWADDVVTIADGIAQPKSAAGVKIRIEARKWAWSLLAGQKHGESSNDVEFLIARLEDARRRVEQEARHRAPEADVGERNEDHIADD